MLKKVFSSIKIPQTSGVYMFVGKNKKILYIGKAGVLRDRVKSYFNERLSEDRGERLVECIKKTISIETIVTDSVLEALLLETNLIKKFNPPYNAKEKDNKSYSFVCITKEEYPCVCIVRGRDLAQNKKKYQYTLGPFPQGKILREVLSIIRKAIPYRTTCKIKSTRKCFDAQIGLCPGVCIGEISKKKYIQSIREIIAILKGKKKKLLINLIKKRDSAAADERFEDAKELQTRVRALNRMRDIHTLHNSFSEGGDLLRIEAYDIAHFHGEHTIGVMVVSYGSDFFQHDYRTFIIKDAKKGDEYGALQELLSRRFRHTEWEYPSLIVLDGGKQQLAVADAVCKEYEIKIPTVSVVKNEHHTARELLGDKRYTHAYAEQIIALNAEAHRFAISKHRKKRRWVFKK
ncbi:MAG: GIY-YIG nuclease family protein [Alphaproteobacteria bacterium]|nr:GIY-YIG nuclease family protein [Alphaproteobacteria bacterium]